MWVGGVGLDKETDGYPYPKGKTGMVPRVAGANVYRQPYRPPALRCGVQTHLY